MHDESKKQPCCNPPWEPPQVIPAQVRRVNNLIFRKINQFHRENNVDNVTPMHDWIMTTSTGTRTTPCTSAISSGSFPSHARP